MWKCGDFAEPCHQPINDHSMADGKIRNKFIEMLKKFYF